MDEVIGETIPGLSVYMYLNIVYSSVLKSVRLFNLNNVAIIIDNLGYN